MTNTNDCVFLGIVSECKTYIFLEDVFRIPSLAVEASREDGSNVQYKNSHRNSSRTIRKQLPGLRLRGMGMDGGGAGGSLSSQASSIIY